MAAPATNRLLAFAFSLSLLPLAQADTSRPRTCPVVLERDAQGRVLRERDRHGWHVAYRRDEFGNVIEKKWIDPKDPKSSWVRLYTFDQQRRLVAEADIQGRWKQLAYDEAGRPVNTVTPDGFIEESKQYHVLRKTDQGGSQP